MKSELRFKPRLGVWKNSTGSLVFNPKTGLGHSYNWYEITKRVKGELILNNYRYSVTTASHVRALRSLLAELGIRFREETAPSGKITGRVA